MRQYFVLLGILTLLVSPLLTDSALAQSRSVKAADYHVALAEKRLREKYAPAMIQSSVDDAEKLLAKATPEDLEHPTYKDLRTRLDAVKQALAGGNEPPEDAVPGPDSEPGVALNPSLARWTTKGLDEAESALTDKPNLIMARRGLDQAAAQLAKATREEQQTSEFKKLKARFDALTARYEKAKVASGAAVRPPEPEAAGNAGVALSPKIARWATRGLDGAESLLQTEPKRPEDLDPARQGLDQARAELDKATAEERGTSQYKELDARYAELQDRYQRMRDQATIARMLREATPRVEEAEGEIAGKTTLTEQELGWIAGELDRANSAFRGARLSEEAVGDPRVQKLLQRMKAVSDRMLEITRETAGALAEAVKDVVPMREASLAIEQHLNGIKWQTSGLDTVKKVVGQIEEAERLLANAKPIADSFGSKYGRTAEAVKQKLSSIGYEEARAAAQAFKTLLDAPGYLARQRKWSMEVWFNLGGLDLEEFSKLDVNDFGFVEQRDRFVAEVKLLPGIDPDDRKVAELAAGIDEQAAEWTKNWNLAIDKRTFKDADCDCAKDPALRKAAEEFLKGTWGAEKRYTYRDVAILGDWHVALKDEIGRTVRMGVTVLLAIECNEDEGKDLLRVFYLTLVTPKYDTDCKPPFDYNFVGDGKFMRKKVLKGR